MTSSLAVPRSLAVLVAGAQFMEMLDGTIIATAAPAMGRSFGVPSTAIGTAMTAYLVTVAAAIPLSGWLVNKWGGRTVYASAIAIFALASALCAVSVNLPMLVAMRVLQGIGGAMMVPVGRLLVLQSVDKSDLMRAIAYLVWPALAAPVIAPALGGLLVTYASWPWIFLVNVPLGIVALPIALRLVPPVRDESSGPLDGKGLVYCAVCLSSVVYLASLLAADRVDVKQVAAFAVLATVFGAVSIRHLATSRTPLLDLSTLRIATFRLAHASGSLFRIVANAMPFLLPLLLQDAFGWSAVRAGACVLAFFLGNMLIKPAALPLLRRLGFRAVLTAAGLAGALAVLACATLDSGTPLVVILAVVFANGVCRSVGFSAYLTLAYADVPNVRMNAATTLGSTVQNLGIGLGVAVGALALRIGQATTDGLASSYRIAFCLLACLLVASAAAAAATAREAGANVLGRRADPAVGTASSAGVTQ